MNRKREFHFDAINWNTLPELEARLARHNVTLQKASVTLTRYPDSIEVESLEEAHKLVHNGFQPRSYFINLWCQHDSREVRIELFRGFNSGRPYQVAPQLTVVTSTIAANGYRYGPDQLRGSVPRGVCLEPHFRYK